MLTQDKTECDDFNACTEPKKQRQTFSHKENAIKTVFTCSKCDKILFDAERIAARPDWVNPNA